MENIIKEVCMADFAAGCYYRLLYNQRQHSYMTC